MAGANEESLDHAAAGLKFLLAQKQGDTYSRMKKSERVALPVCLLSLLFLIGCSGSASKQAEAPKEFGAMLAKMNELAALPTTEKLSKKPEIKGKIALVSSNNGSVSLDRFHESGEAFFTDLPVAGEIYAHFLPPDLYAKKPEEIETLIKVNCNTKKDTALYSSAGSSKVEPMEYDYVLCDIECIDYKTATVFAKKQVGKNEAPNLINKNTYGKTPGREIADYLQSIAGVAKPEVSGK